MVLAADRLSPERHGVRVVEAMLVALVLLLIAAPLLRGLSTPAAATSSTQEVRLQVVGNGGYLLDGRPVSQTDLMAALRRARTASPDLRLRIATADESDYRAFVGALAVAERAGVRNIGSETR